MPFKLFIYPVRLLINVGQITRQSFKMLAQNPQIAVYPYAAALFISISLPIVNGVVFSVWNHFGHSTIFSLADGAPHRLRLLLGLVAFSVFYTAFITAFFTCATSAAVLAKLEGRNVIPLHEFRAIIYRFFRIAKFGLLSIFFFPLGIIAQYKKLNGPRGFIEVLGSSLSLHVGQLAPVIMTKNKGVLATIQYSMDTLGKAWQEGLVVKVLMYLSILLLASLSFLPKLVDHYISGEAAHIAGWSATVLIGATGYVAIKVIGTVFTTTLYHHAKNQRKR